MSKVIASLNEDGWITDSKKILRYLLNYYILSDAAQSLMFQDKIINLPETYFKYINDPDGMRLGIKQDLDKLLSRYFPFVDVQTEVKKLTDSAFGILLSASVIDDDGIRHELSVVSKINTNKDRDVIEINNYGTGVDFLNNL